jgi:cell division protease FtsH
MENDRIVVIAATNHELLMERALIRSGRFDTKIRIELPSAEDREGIINIKMRDLKGNQIRAEVVKSVAVKAEGFSGADIDTMVNEMKYL